MCIDRGRRSGARTAVYSLRHAGGSYFFIELQAACQPWVALAMDV